MGYPRDWDSPWATVEFRTEYWGRNPVIGSAFAELNAFLHKHGLKVGEFYTETNADNKGEPIFILKYLKSARRW